eukprot:TRINITY_DN4563_c0_g1_i3.p1 TRINITY_DN4563_c0_g1~~TRINITY_DN4563_c0_g1_i3.p1  ORF type:complete len:164 (-),score=20.22 TRINITY_DN4563_c0_g1_i3:71-562(-)
MEQTKEKRQQLQQKLHAMPTKRLMKIFTLVMMGLVVASIVVNLFLTDTDWLEAFANVALFISACILTLACIPDKLQNSLLKYFLFLQNYPGKATYMVFMGILMFGLGIFSIIVGAFLIILAAVHFILWFFFREVVDLQQVAITPENAPQTDLPTDTGDLYENL